MELDHPSHVRLELWFDFRVDLFLSLGDADRPPAREAGVEVASTPFLLGPILQSGGQTSPFNIFPIKGRYMWRDVERFASTYACPCVGRRRFRNSP